MENVAERFDGYTLLMAEDNEESYAYMRIACSKAGFTVLRAKTGKEAVELCALHPEINLILMDGMMPEMTGYEATSIIKKNNPGIPIVIITAFVSQASIYNAVASGCNDYLAKPIGVTELFMAIKKWVIKPV
jgi:CheY-like chemotaxis protein